MVLLNRTTVKILGKSAGVICEVTNCGTIAKFLFRICQGRICAYCPNHASETARALGVTLPDPSADSKQFAWRV